MKSKTDIKNHLVSLIEENNFDEFIEIYKETKQSIPKIYFELLVKSCATQTNLFFLWELEKSNKFRANKEYFEHYLFKNAVYHKNQELVEHLWKNSEQEFKNIAIIFVVKYNRFEFAEIFLKTKQITNIEDVTSSILACGLEEKYKEKLLMYVKFCSKEELINS